MHKLDLSNPEESQIPFKISKFPDGQQSVEIGDNLFTYSISEEAVQIRSRFNSFRDLELIICATRALRGLGVKEIHLYVPYFLGARSVAGHTNHISHQLLVHPHKQLLLAVQMMRCTLLLSMLVV